MYIYVYDVRAYVCCIPLFSTSKKHLSICNIIMLTWHLCQHIYVNMRPIYVSMQYNYDNKQHY